MSDTKLFADRPFMLGAVLAILAAIVLAACASPVQNSAKGGSTVRVSLPFAAAAKGARVLAPTMDWVQLTISDGTTTTTQTAVGGGSSANFSATLTAGTAYTFSAAAGTGTAGSGTTLFAGSASATIYATTTSLPLYLMPVSPMPVSSAASTLDPPLAAGAYAAYEVDLGSNSRLVLSNLPADWAIYVQNPGDGSPVEPALNADGYYVVEKSALASGASSFLISFLNTGASTETPTLPLTFDTTSHWVQVAALGTTSSVGITHIGRTLYAADHYGYINVFNTQTNVVGTRITSYCPNIFGISTDGTNLYASAGDYTPKVWKAAPPFTSAGDWTRMFDYTLEWGAGCAYLDGYVYFVRTGSDSSIYKIPAGSSGLTDFTSATAVLTGTHGIGGMCSDGSKIYFINTSTYADHPDETGVYSLDPSTGTTVKLGSLTTSINFCAVGGGYVYYNSGTILQRAPADASGSAGDVLDFNDYGYGLNSMDVLADGSVYALISKSGLSYIARVY